MENPKSLQENLRFLFEKKESLQQFLPFLRKIPNFNIFQMNTNADSLYHISIIYSRKDLIEYFIRQDYKVSLPNKSLETPLHLACEKGETEITILLIKNTKNLNIQDYEGNTPLHKAMICQEKNKTIIMNLVKNGCDMNKVNMNNETPLMYGISKGITKNVEYLLEFNVDLSIKNSQKNDAMYLACFNKNAVIFEKILRKINDFEPKINGNLMVLAIKKKSLEIVQILISNGVPIKDSDLKLALELGFSQIWLYLNTKKYNEKYAKEDDDLSDFGDFITIKTENDVLKRKLQDYDKMINILMGQLDEIKQEVSILKKDNIELKDENDFMKSELQSLKSTKNIKEILASIPSEINSFIQDKGISNDLESLMINPNDLLIKKQIGSGGFATVYKGLIYGTKVAIKMIDHTKFDKKVMDSFLKEVNLLKKIRHPHIISLMGIIIQEKTLGIITEYMQNKSIIDLIKICPDLFSFQKKIKMALQIAQAMTYLHSLKPPILHRDLKSANCLCDENFTIKVADLGMAKIKDNLNSYTNSIGTPEYMAPEFISNQVFYNKSDVFSYGMVLWEIFNVEKAFNEVHPATVIFQISNKKRPILMRDKIQNEEICELIEECWQDNKDLRPDFEEILLKLKVLYKKSKI